MPETLKRKSFLKRKNDIENLFAKGKKKNFDCIRVVYYTNKCVSPQDCGIRIFVSAPKKFLHHACQRNLAKRRMKENIRKNLTDLIVASKNQGLSIDLGFVYQSNTVINYYDIEKIIVLSLQKIYSDIYETNI